MRLRQVRRSLVALGLLLALAPLSAVHAEDGNQAAIDKIKAEKTALANLPALEQGVMLGQAEIANAKAIAAMLHYDAHAQTYLPNSMQQYNQFCDGAIATVQAQLTNAAAMAMDKPWDPHAQAELANANAMKRQLWDTIGTTYPGNPYLVKQVRAPGQVPVLSDDQVFVADDQVMAVGDEEMVAAAGDEELVATVDEAAIVAEDVPELAAD